MLNLGIDPSTKRNLVIDENNRWVGTLPLQVSEPSVTKPTSPISPLESMLPGVQPSESAPDELKESVLPRDGMQPSDSKLSESTSPISLSPLESIFPRDSMPQSESMHPSESKPAMPQSESMHPSESDQSDVVRIVKEQRSALTKLEEQLQIERSERKMLEEQLRVERSALTRLEEQFKAKEQNLRVSSALKEKEEGTSFSDKSETASQLYGRAKDTVWPNR